MSKLLLRSVVMASLAAVALAFVVPARAEEKAEKADKSKEKHWAGTIEAIDAQAKTVTLKKKTVSKTFKCTEDCKFVTKDKKEAAMTDLKVGDEVNVIYTEKDGTMMARRVAQKMEKEEKAGEKEKETK